MQFGVLSFVQGTMYAFGGNVGQTSLSTCEKYDPHLDRWTYIASMKHRRAGAAAVVGLVDKYIYVFGKLHYLCLVYDKRNVCSNLK